MQKQQPHPFSMGRRRRQEKLFRDETQHLGDFARHHSDNNRFQRIRRGFGGTDDMVEFKNRISAKNVRRLTRPNSKPIRRRYSKIH